MHVTMFLLTGNAKFAVQSYSEMYTWVKVCKIYKNALIVPNMN